jgi:phosphopantothenate---cysteine ligase (CTP)
LNVLITAGGTSEKIDDVRKISNTATGRLGSLVADCFLADESVSVTCLCSENAVLPKNPRARILRISDVQSLQRAVEEEMHARAYDAVIHSMAVSDYRVKYSAPSEWLAAQLAKSIGNGSQSPESLAAQIHAALLAYNGGDRPKKISSDIENVFLCLEKTPKIIGLFKKLQPQTILVGFKLLAGVEEAELFGAARNLMKRNGCDFVLANDQEQIDENRHEAVLLGKDHSITRLHTKAEIAAAIKEHVMRKAKEDGQK